jgi:hypothetical protein
MKYISVLSLFLCLICCISTKKAILPDHSTLKDPELEFKFDPQIKIGSVASFELKNNSQKPITIFGPWLKNIQKYENGNWRKVRILSCRCGSNCVAPPRTLVIQPSEKYFFDWNLMEGWCDKRQANGIPLTIEYQSPEGLYSVSVNYSIDGTSREKITREFTIIN